MIGFLAVVSYVVLHYRCDFTAEFPILLDWMEDRAVKSGMHGDDGTACSSSETYSMSRSMAIFSQAMSCLPGPVRYRKKTRK
jgi:hypothetical protein